MSAAQSYRGLAKVADARARARRVEAGRALCQADMAAFVRLRDEAGDAERVAAMYRAWAAREAVLF